MDGRNQRVERTKAAIIAACREAMKAGIFQPSVADVAKAAEISMRSIFQHYGSVAAMHLAAIKDDETSREILFRIMGDGDFQLPLGAPERIVRAIVLGHVG